LRCSGEPNGKGDPPPRNLDGLEESYPKEERVDQDTHPSGPLGPAGSELSLPPHPAQPPHLSWLLGGETVVFLALVAAAMGGGYHYFQQQFAGARSAVDKELLAIGDLKAGQIADWYQERQRDAIFHFQNPTFQALARTVLAGAATATEKQDMLAWMEETRSTGDYRRVVLCGAQGSARLAAPEGSGSTACEGDLPAALTARGIVTTDLHQESNVRPGQRNAVSMGIWVPIAAKPEGNMSAAGALMLEIDPYRFLYPLIQSWPTPSPTAETLLVRRDDGHVVFLNDLRHRAGAAFSNRLQADPLSRVPAAMAAAGKVGLVEGVDYRGVPVLAAVRGVPGTPWFMVAKVDREEIYAPLRRLVWQAGIAIAGMLAVTGLGLALLWQRHNASWLRTLMDGERAIQTLAERLLILNKYANESILLADDRLNILEANDCALWTYGYSLSELRGMTLPDLCTPETRAEAPEVYNKLEAASAASFERIHARKNGTVLSVEGSVDAAEIGGRRYYQAIFRDITERTQAEEERRHLVGELADRVGELQAILDAAPVAIWMAHDPQCLRITGNAFADRVVMQTEQGGNVSAGARPGDEAVAYRVLRDGVELRPEELPNQIAAATGQPAKQEEFALVFPDGRTVHMLLGAVPLFDAEGRVRGSVAAGADITQRKRAEEAVRKSEERLGMLFRTMIEGFCIVEVILDADFQPVDCRFLETNPAFETQSGLKNAKGRLMRDMVPDLEAHWFEVYGQVALTGQPARFVSEAKALHRWYDVSAYRVGGPESRKVAVLFNDVTERHGSEEAVRRLNAELDRRVRDRTAQLEAVNRELEAFSYSVSHDLRAPLRGIDGWSMALLEDYSGKLDGQAREYLDRVRGEAQHMGQLIDDLLQLARVSREHMEHGPLDLTAMANVVDARLRRRQPERCVEFSAQPGLTARGDPRLVDIALSNLLDNAWKFSGPRPVARIEFGRLETAGVNAFFVRDNGVGFDMAYVSKLFGAFQRLHRTSEFPGTGIGLATVQRVVFRHGGRVWAEAQPDCGATVYFTLERAA
jgi:PAS domain S-box-containing protein